MRCPSVSRVTALAASLLALALPAGAAAQSGAGDNQYADPFGGSTQGSHSAPKPHRQASHPRATPTVSSTTTPAPAPQPVAPAATSSAAAAPPTAASATGAASASSAAATLPYTGIAAWQEALAGAMLLVAGLLLRTRRRRAS